MYSGVSFEKQHRTRGQPLRNGQCESIHKCMRNNPDEKPPLMKRLILTQGMPSREGLNCLPFNISLIGMHSCNGQIVSWVLSIILSIKQEIQVLFKYLTSLPLYIYCVFFYKVLHLYMCYHDNRITCFIWHNCIIYRDVLLILFDINCFYRKL